MRLYVHRHNIIDIAIEGEKVYQFDSKIETNYVYLLGNGSAIAPSLFF